MPLRLTILASICALAVSGCLGDPVATRRLEVGQVQSSDTPTGKFDLDVSQLPLGSYSRVEDKDQWGNPVTKLNIVQGKAVRIIVVPATQP